MPLDDHRLINGVVDGRVKQQATGAIRKRIGAPDLGVTDDFFAMGGYAAYV